ncbi:molybdopterin-containing oxidoreductase family protein [Desulfitobacterium sp. AusDCA]|uniref:molybdopterin-containing oxidoreductase family protein n=1 Tax=Desulfitobacterium sp. AusDCA TaxID=3240383 RepID=UPI003DA7647E
MSKEKVLEKLKKQHEGEQVFYHTCLQNGCWDAACIVRSRVKDGKIVAFEPDNSINKGAGREDVGEEAINKGMVQARPCTMGHAWKEEMYAPTRINYPMKRVGGKGFGNGHLERISWEEALDTIAEKIKETIDLYGPYSILHTQYSFFRTSSFPLGPYIKAGVASWGDHSTSGHTAGEKFHLGYDLVKSLIPTGEQNPCVGYEAPDLFNSNLIVLWAHNPLVGWFGQVSYYMKLAKEKGIPIIVIDPVYTMSAEILADQWIPIRPGTDLAMMLAVAHVLFEEDLYDHEYVAKNVEPEGFVRFRNYIMGGEDGEAKTPEWAEKICTVPAETIRDFARLYAKSKPVHLQYHYGAAKRHLGEYSASMAMLLQSMTGNLTIPGGCETGCTLVTPSRLPIPQVDFQKAPPEYKAPVQVNNQKWAEAVVLREEYDKGNITETEYRRAIGCPLESPLPNIQMLVFENNWLNNQHHVNKRLQAAAKVHFSWGFMWHLNQPTAQWMDIVLPSPIHMFETTDPYLLGQQRFMSAPAGMRNYFVYSQKAVQAPGEVRSKEWVYTQLANRLGVGEKYNPLLKDVPWDKWDETVDGLYRQAYEEWAKDEWGMLETLGIEPKPWEEFLKEPIVRVPIEEPYHAFKDVLDQGINPFKNTPSGKIEFVSKYLESVDLRNTDYGGRMDPMPRWEPSYMSEPANDSFYHPKTKMYPLALNTPVSIFRQHSANDQNPLLRDCYKHSVWMNPADAKTRNIESDELVFVYNEYGEIVLPVYITSKIMPGTAAIYHGGWYQPNGVKTETMPYGIDRRGACNLLIGDTHLPHALGALLTAGLVEIKKFGGAN